MHRRLSRFWAMVGVMAWLVSSSHTLADDISVQPPTHSSLVEPRLSKAQNLRPQDPYAYIGDLESPADREEMATVSPIHYVDRITQPLLVVQGANDVRVVRAHSDRIVEVARKNGVDVHYHHTMDGSRAICVPLGKM